MCQSKKLLFSKMYIQLSVSNSNTDIVCIADIIIYTRKYRISIGEWHVSADFIIVEILILIYKAHVKSHRQEIKLAHANGKCTLKEIF
jgi:hypothetical protein